MDIEIRVWKVEGLVKKREPKTNLFLTYVEWCNGIELHDQKLQIVNEELTYRDLRSFHNKVGEIVHRWLKVV